MLTKCLMLRIGVRKGLVLLAVGALVNAMGTEFLKYMDAFFPYIETGLQVSFFPSPRRGSR